MLQAVKQNGGALAYADPALQEDRGADRDPVAEVVENGRSNEGNLTGNLQGFATSHHAW